jgi:hypothetical protein
LGKQKKKDALAPLLRLEGLSDAALAGVNLEMAIKSPTANASLFLDEDKKLLSDMR